MRVCPAARFEDPILDFPCLAICSWYLTHVDKSSHWRVGLLAKVFPHAIQRTNSSYVIFSIFKYLFY